MRSRFRALGPVTLGCAVGAHGCSLLYSADDLSRAQGNGGSPEGGRGGPSRCDSSFLFCDGFENGLMQWNEYSSGGGRVAVDSSRAYRGSFSLHSWTLGPDSGSADAAWTTLNAAVFHDQPWPSLFYVRFFAYFESPWIAAEAEIFNSVVPGSGGPPPAGLSIFLEGGTGHVGTQVWGIPGGASVASAVAPPLGQWVCFELEVNGDARASSSIQVWMNGTTVSGAAQNVQVLQLGRLAVGLGNIMSDGPAYDSWFDEVAADVKPIGCER